MFLPRPITVRPNSGTTTFPTIKITKAATSIASTRLTGLAILRTIFESFHFPLPNTFLSINCIGTFNTNAIPQPTRNGKNRPTILIRKSSTTSRFCRPTYKSTVKRIRYIQFFMFSFLNSKISLHPGSFSDWSHVSCPGISRTCRYFRYDTFYHGYVFLAREIL